MFLSVIRLYKPVLARMCVFVRVCVLRRRKNDKILCNAVPKVLFLFKISEMTIFYVLFSEKKPSALLLKSDISILDSRIYFYLP